MEVSLSAIIAQIINFGIIFWLFSKFAAKPLANAIESRKELLKKLENADDAYDQKIQIAQLEAKEIVQEGIERKEKLISEAGILANNKRDEILAEAKLQSQKIIDAAQNNTKILKEDLEKSFIAGVKRTSLLVVKKLIKKDPEINRKYLDEAIEEVVKT